MRPRAPAPQRILPFGRLSPGSARPFPRRGAPCAPGAARRPAGRGRARVAARRGTPTPADAVRLEREKLRRRQFERLMERLRGDALLLADHFDLRYRAILIERPTARSHYGVCYRDGTIKIRLNHAVYLRPLRYSSLINTVCHELAHLEHFDHGEGFRRFYAQILEWARARRIYRPRGRGAEQAVLDLEEAGDCRVDAGEVRGWLDVMRRRLGKFQEGAI